MLSSQYVMTSETFEWLYDNRARCIAKIYRAWQDGDNSRPIRRFIMAKDRFLPYARILRDLLNMSPEVTGELVRQFYLADHRMEEAWEIWLCRRPKEGAY